MKVNIKRVLLAGIAVGLLNGLWSWLTCGKLFTWIYRLEPIFVWKTMGSISFALANVAGLVFSILLALVYALIHKALPGKGIVKGLWFGVGVWLVGAFPINFCLGLFTRINQTVITYWIIAGLVAELWHGLVIAAIYKE